MDEFESAPTGVAALNVALARALGCSSAECLSRVELVIEPGKLPVVKATLLLGQADGLRAVVHQFNLAPQPIPAEEARDAT